MTEMAASGAVSMPVSIIGTSKPNRKVDTVLPTNWPPRTTPKMIDKMVKPSTQPLALTNCELGSSSVKMPYLAGE